MRIWKKLFGAKASVQRVWHNPDYKVLGHVVLESMNQDGRNKAVIILNDRGHYVFYGYFLDDSDRVAGYSDSLGWVSDSGPSITDTLENAKNLAEEYLTRGRNKSEG